MRSSVHRPSPLSIVASLVAVLALAALPATAQSFPGGEPITIVDLTQDGPRLPAEPPAAVVSSSGEATTVTPDHTQLANFAWREFIALSAPAATPLPANRGVVSSSQSFLDSGQPKYYQQAPGKNLLVWETYAHRSELFPTGPVTKGKPPTGAAPQPWAQSPRYVYHGSTDANGNVEGAAPDFSTATLTYNNLDETSQIGQNFLFFPKNPPNPATDFKDDYQVLFEAKVNKVERDYVAGQRGTGQPPKNLNLSTVQLPPNASSTGETVEVKAAWRELGPNEDASRYHTANVLYYTGPDDAPVAENGTYALVALHIIRKTENYPNFIFATFEHVDALRLPTSSNELNPSGEATGLYYVTAYNDLQYDPSQPKGETPTAYVYGSQTSGYSDDPPQNEVVTEKLPTSGPIAKASNGVVAPMAGPFPVVQPPTFTREVVQVNSSVRNLIRDKEPSSVWQYYQLKGVQYVPSNEIASPSVQDARALDYYLANIVVESSQPGIQLFKGGAGGPRVSGSTATFEAPRDPGVVFPTKGTAAPNTNPHVIMGGCMGCHGQAKAVGGPAPPTGFAAVNGHNKNPETYLLSPEDQLYHNYYDDGSWQSWTSSDGAAKGAPLGISGFAVLNGHNSNVESYLVDPTNTLYHNHYDGSWQSWTSSDSAVQGSPPSTTGFGAVNLHNSNTEVFLVATDHTVYHNYYDGSWQTWSSTSSAVSGAPDATSGFASENRHNKNVEAFLVGLDGTLYHNYYDGSWQTWSSTSSAVSGAPKAIGGFASENRHNKNVEVFLIAVDGTLYHNYYDGSWQTWSKTSPAVSSAPLSNSGFAASNNHNDNVEAFLVANDGTLYHNYYDGSWQTWSKSDGASKDAPSGLLSYNHYKSFLLPDQTTGLAADTVLGDDESTELTMEKMRNRVQRFQSLKSER